LAEFEDYPGVGVNWANFGTGGHVTAPPGLVIESYLLRSSNERTGRTIKSIVQPARVREAGNPHFFRYRDGLAVDEQRRPISGPDFAYTESCSFSLLRINHYWSKSEEEFREKARHPRADTGLVRGIPGSGRLPEPLPGSIEDTTILAYLPLLKKALGQAE
jgi:hypothetical protein